MKEVETKPGKTYAVECVGEVVVTNTETGAVVAQGDGSGQVLFTACGSSYTLSDDDAKVVALFKLAPRLRLALLQGVAGGWLPKGYTALDYLESSGTQYIDTGYVPNNETGLRIASLTWLNVDFIPFGCRNSDTTNTRVAVVRARIANENVQTFRIGFGWGEWLNLPVPGTPPHGNPWSGFLNWRNCRKARGETESLVTETSLKELSFDPTFSLYLFAQNIAGVASYQYAGKITAAGISQGEKIVHDFVPALRNADSEPGMFDTVSRQFFTNAGSGTFGYRVKRTGETVSPMSLRDPWRVAPSGIWARPAGVNGLEFVADTEEVDGDDWLHFANTADAYEHFGVVQEEILTE